MKQLLTQTYMGWELYWVSAVAILFVALYFFQLHRFHSYVRENRKIIDYNVAERAELEEEIASQGDLIKELRDKIHNQRVSAERNKQRRRS